MANDNEYSPTISGQIDRIQDSKEKMRVAINSYFPDDEQITEEATIDSYAEKILAIPNNFNATLVGEFDEKNESGEVTKYSKTYIKAIEQVKGVITAQAGDVVTEALENSPALITSGGVFNELSQYTPLTTDEINDIVNSHFNLISGSGSGSGIDDALIAEASLDDDLEEPANQ